MTIADFDKISMNGRMAYSILCVEKYLLDKFPNDDWESLSRLMWEATSSLWDEWADKFIEIIPEYLFEKPTFLESDFEELTEEEYNEFVLLLKDKPDTVNQLLLKLYELEQVYSYTSIPETGKEASQIVLDICSILEENEIPLPDLSTVQFSSFSEKNGWGNNFEGAAISLILNC